MVGLVYIPKSNQILYFAGAIEMIMQTCEIRFLKLVKKGVLTTLFILVGFGSMAQNYPEYIVTNRPSVTTGPYTLDPGHIQFESGLGMQWFGDAASGNLAFSLPGLAFRWGLLEGVEIGCYDELTILNAGSAMLVGGGSPRLDIKFDLTREGKYLPSIAMNLSARMPFGGRKEFLPDNVAPVANLLISKNFTKVFALTGNLGIDWDGSSPVPGGFYTLHGNFMAKPFLQLYAEIFGRLDDGIESAFGLGGGVLYAFHPHLQVDLSFGMALPDANIGFAALGFSWRYLASKKARSG